MDLRILTLTTLCLGISYAAPMSMQNIKITLNNSGLVWQDMDSMPLYEGYQNKIWGCGRGWSLRPWKQFTLFAEGQVAKGNCGTEFIVTRSERCKDEICVDPQELHIGTNGISIMFENEKKDVTKTLTSTDQTMAKTCFLGNKLMFKVTTGQSSSIDLKFQFLVYPNCPGIPKDVIMESDKDSQDFSRAEELEAAMTKNLILGIVTAGCICVVFIIILIIVYCYFRGNPDITRHRYTEETKPLRK
uniref:Uncharacterized protein LOC111106473 n=1 Tax=Crassostrea virginica TaxID=6565 RepID=A0A8B8B1H4_CRAVI|nr:uncharacterized protein LOC111106473 [Crassostrea virginica]XP_022296879.1 uncharacterized protein LOC111106473 [Crassostrea virginica]